MRSGDLAQERELLGLRRGSLAQPHRHRDQAQQVENLERLEVDVGDVQFAERRARVGQIAEIEAGPLAQVGDALAGPPQLEGDLLRPVPGRQLGDQAAPSGVRAALSSRSLSFSNSRVSKAWRCM